MTDQVPWASWLPDIMYALNTEKHKTMKDMPYRVVFWRVPPAPLLPQAESQVIDDTENKVVPAVDLVEPDERLSSSSTSLPQTEKLVTPPSPVLSPSTFIPQGELSITAQS